MSSYQEMSVLENGNPPSSVAVSERFDSKVRNRTMGNCFAGIWIDHEQAHIVNVCADGTTTSLTIEAKAERRRRTTGQSNVPLPAHPNGNAEGQDRNRRTGQFSRYYDRVIRSLPQCAGIIIVGPGFAKRELWNRIKLYPNWEPLILSVQTAGAMTAPQIAEHVRDVASSRLLRNERASPMSLDNKRRMRLGA